MTLAPAIQPPRLSTLAAVELRKATDTRAGRWLLLLVGLVAASVSVVYAITGKASAHSASAMLSHTTQAAAFLLPVAGILLVTSEWSQRTSLTTFTLTPRRSRIVVAKLMAGVSMGVGAGTVCILIAAGSWVFASHPAATSSWNADAGMMASTLAFVSLNVLLGVGFGLLFTNTPVAIVAYFALPTAWSVTTSTVHFLRGAGDWLDPSTVWSHLADGTWTTQQLGQLLLCTAIWVATPVLAGNARLQRAAL